jgi:hypothetical protein
MVSIRKLLGGKGSLVLPLIAGMAGEYAMKTTAFSINGGLNLPKPRQDIIKVTGEWLGQPHIIVGAGSAFLIPMVLKGEKGKIFRTAMLGYLGGKYVSENFGVENSPFKTSPKAKPLYDNTANKVTAYGVEEAL